MPKQIILVHGRGFKPMKPRYERLWRDAITAGFERDRPDLLPALAEAKIEMAYYADLSAEWLSRVGKRPRKNDFRPMERTGCRIVDHRIYNPAIRKGKPNPHEGTGYLIHPKFVQTLGKWLETDA